MSAFGPLVPAAASIRPGCGPDNNVILRTIALIRNLHQKLLILARRYFIKIVDPHRQPPGVAGGGRRSNAGQYPRRLGQ